MPWVKNDGSNDNTPLSNSEREALDNSPTRPRESILGTPEYNKSKEPPTNQTDLHRDIAKSNGSRKR
jgi:hypothetical protein